MTYELPDEVRRRALSAIYESPASDGFENDLSWSESENVLDALTPILAPHFERSGAEKMREAAANAVMKALPWNPDSEWTEAYEAQVNVLTSASRVVRALPLPAQHVSQATNPTEEA